MNKRLFILGLSLVIAASATGQDGGGESVPEKLRNDRARGIVLPKSDTHYQQTMDYVEESPDADYLHA
ncbi:MAG: hypothetical protein LBQ78_02705, partial [Tannerellaceae bacterium]|nr:hypothetical protein [Tannerellaceae bacterium]